MRQGNWAAIQPGDRVVLYGSKPEMHATVEDRTADGSVIWIRDELNERRLIHIDDYSEVCFVENVMLQPTVQKAQFSPPRAERSSLQIRRSMMKFLAVAEVTVTGRGEEISSRLPAC